MAHLDICSEGVNRLRNLDLFTGKSKFFFGKISAQNSDNTVKIIFSVFEGDKYVVKNTKLGQLALS